MWTFRAQTAIATISYDSISGGFLANLNGRRLGSVSFTPQDSIQRILQVAQEQHLKICVPTDLGLWEQSGNSTSDNP